MNNAMWCPTFPWILWKMKCFCFLLKFDYRPFVNIGIFVLFLLFQQVLLLTCFCPKINIIPFLCSISCDDFSYDLHASMFHLNCKCRFLCKISFRRYCHVVATLKKWCFLCFVLFNSYNSTSLFLKSGANINVKCQVVARSSCSGTKGCCCSICNDKLTYVHPLLVVINRCLLFCSDCFRFVPITVCL